MKRWMGMAVVAALVSWNGTALAADPAAPSLSERVKVLEDKISAQKFSLSGLLGIDFSGYVDASYEYNFNQPDTGANGLRVFDYSQANGFELHQAVIAFRRSPTAGPDLAQRAGFGVTLLFGDDAQVIAPYPQNLNPINSRSLVDVEEAYAEFLAPIGSGLDIKFGKFVTSHGAEVIDIRSDYNVSRSILFGFAIPFTHTGIRAHYDLNPKFGLTAGIMNGWDNVRDDNKGKTGELGFNAAPNDKLGIVATLMYGEEGIPPAADARFLADAVITVKPMDKVTLVLNADYGTQENAALPGTGDNNAKWYGVAGYVHYDATDKAGLTLRGEVFRDGNGFRTGSEMTAWEMTATGAYKLTQNLETRLELRHDASSADVFDKEGAPLSKGTQDTVAVQALYTF